MRRVGSGPCTATARHGVVTDSGTKPSQALPRGRVADRTTRSRHPSGWRNDVRQSRHGGRRAYIGLRYRLGGFAMRILMIGALVLASLAPDRHTAQSARDIALLNENPSGSSYQGRLFFPNYNKSSSGYKDFRTRIDKSVKSGPNFAGKYAITVFSCGSGCAMGYMTDVSNGHVSALPFSVRKCQ